MKSENNRIGGFDRARGEEWEIDNTSYFPTECRAKPALGPAPEEGYFDFLLRVRSDAEERGYASREIEEVVRRYDHMNARRIW